MAGRKKKVKEMKSVAEWLGQWPGSPAAVLAVGLARSAESLPQTLAWTFRPWPGVPSPAPSRWIRFYRKHRDIRAIGECFGMGPLSAIGPLEPLSASQEAVLRGDGGEYDRACVVAEAKARAAVHPNGAGVFGPGAAAMRSDESQFLGRVVLPYLIAYGEWPTRDYRRARQRDFAALERLLSVDKGVIEDRRIRQWHTEVGLDRNTVQGAIIAKALVSEPIELSVKQAKMFAAAVISWMFASVHLLITEPQVRKLFDLLAQERGLQIDIDIPGSPESLAKGMQRGRATLPRSQKSPTKNAR